jgi:hypothetical protein
MLNRNPSAGTAAKKSSKCSLLQRPAIILAMLLLCAVYFVKGQDTSYLKTLTDTSFRTLSIGDIKGLSIASISYENPNEYKTDTITIKMLLSIDNVVKSVDGYAVRNITITKAGNHRDGFYMWYINKDEYSYSTKYYLDDKKIQLPKNWVVWQSVSK